MNKKGESSKVSGIKIALAVVPALLVVSIIVALYLGATADKEKSKPYEGEVTVDEMSNYLEKLHDAIGERRIDTEEGQRAFRQINAMTDGAFQNLGYQVSRSQTDKANGLLWPTLWVDAGEEEDRDVVVVAIPQAESGTGPAFGYGFAEYLATHAPATKVRVVFYPPLVRGPLASWVWERCAGEEEQLKGFVKVTGSDPDDRETVFSGPVDSGILTALKESKLWNETLRVGREATEGFEVALLEQGRVSRQEQALHLIRLMPVIKELTDRLGTGKD